MHVILIAMYGTNYISQCINISIGEDAPGMGTFEGKGKYPIMVLTDTYLFVVQFRDRDIIISKIQITDLIGYFVPGIFFLS